MSEQTKSLANVETLELAPVVIDVERLKQGHITKLIGREKGKPLAKKTVDFLINLAVKHKITEIQNVQATKKRIRAIPDTSKRAKVFLYESKTLDHQATMIKQYIETKEPFDGQEQLIKRWNDDHTEEIKIRDAITAEQKLAPADEGKSTMPLGEMKVIVDNVQKTVLDNINTQGYMTKDDKEHLQDLLRLQLPLHGIAIRNALHSVKWDNIRTSKENFIVGNRLYMNIHKNRKEYIFDLPQQIMDLVDLIILDRKTENGAPLADYIFRTKTGLEMKEGYYGKLLTKSGDALFEKGHGIRHYRYKSTTEFELTNPTPAQRESHAYKMMHSVGAERIYLKPQVTDLVKMTEAEIKALHKEDAELEKAEAEAEASKLV